MIRFGKNLVTRLSKDNMNVTNRIIIIKKNNNNGPAYGAGILYIVDFFSYTSNR